MSGCQMAILAAGGDTLQLSDQNISDSNPAADAVTYAVQSDGIVRKSTSSGGLVVLESWISPPFNMALYSIRAHVNSGSSTTGSAVDSDLALSADRSWSISQSGAGTTVSQLLVTLKRISDGVTMKTATINLSAQAI